MVNPGSSTLGRGDPARRGSAAALLALACLAGFAARLGATRLPLFHDEAATLLAAQRIAESGVPVLPSGVLYLHGAVLSYLLAPLGWLGWLDIANVENLRLINAAIGVAAIPLAWLVGRQASGSRQVGFAAAAFIALDPASVLWGSYLRMYALLEVLAAGFALAFLHAISAPAERPNRAALGWMVATFWLAMFSQTVAALLLPAAAAVAAALFGRELIRSRRSLTGALAACAGAVAAYLALTRLGSTGGAASIAPAGGVPLVRFLGDDQIDLSRLIEPNAWPVREVLGGHPFGEVLPFMMIGLVCVAAGRLLTAVTPADWPARGAGALLAIGMAPVLALVFLVHDAGERYLSGSLVPLLALAAWGLWLLRPGWPAFAPLAGWAARALVFFALAGMVLARDGWMLTHLRDWAPLRYGDQRAAIAAIAAERESGDLVIGNFPVVMAETLGSAEGVRFLNDTGLWAGPSPDGSPRDYWLGNPMITTAGALCETAAANPGSFIVAAKIQYEYWTSIAPPPAMFVVIEGVSRPFHRDASARVYRIEDEKRWEAGAAAACLDAGARPSGPSRGRPEESLGRPVADRERPHAAPANQRSPGRPTRAIPARWSAPVSRESRGAEWTADGRKGRPGPGAP